MTTTTGVLIATLRRGARGVEMEALAAEQPEADAARARGRHLRAVDDG